MLYLLAPLSTGSVPVEKSVDNEGSEMERKDGRRYLYIYIYLDKRSELKLLG